MATTSSLGFTAIQVFAAGIPAKALLLPPQDGTPAQRKRCSPSLQREGRTESQSTVAIQCHSVPTSMVAVTD